MHRYILLLIILLLPLTSLAQWDDPIQMPTPRDGMTSVVDENILYIIGGAEWQRGYATPVNEVLRFDLFSKSWLEPLPDMNYPRYFAASAILNGRIYVFGGRADHTDSAIVDMVETYDLYSSRPDSASWEILSGVTFNSYGASATTLNDTIMITGGYNDSELWTNNFRKFIQINDSNELIEQDDGINIIPFHISHHVSFCLRNTLYMYGGYSEFGPMSIISKYTRNGWEVVDSTEIALAGMAVTKISIPDNETWEIKEYALISGGRNLSNEVTSDMFLIDSLGVVRDFEIKINNTIQNIDLPDNGLFYHIMESTMLSESDLAIVVAGGSYLFLDRQVPTPDLNITTFDISYDVKDELAPLPNNLKISSFPNPANGSMKFNFQIDPHGGEIKLVLYNILGKELQNWHFKPGVSEYTMNWDGTIAGKPASAGIYFLNIRQDNNSESLKLCRLP